MKKIILGVIVLCIFLAYSLKTREESPVLTAPASIANTNKPPGNNVTAGTPVSPSPSATNAKNYKDGSYTGNVADAFYGSVQVKAIISNNKITSVEFLRYPNERATSVRISSQAIPYLQQEAIQVQSANVDVVSGATLTSQAFIESLSNALSQAKI